MLKMRDTYKFCTKCRAELEQYDGYKACPACGKHYYLNPKPCVAILLTNSKDEVLLIKRARDPFKDWWDVPGGFVEEDETFEDAIRRETKEETGLEILDLEYQGSLFEDYEFKGVIVPVVAAIFSGSIADGAVINVDEDENSAYQLVSKADVDIDRIAFENQRQFLRRLLLQ